MTKRPEYIRCVMHTHTKKLNTSWCGKELWRYDIPFVDIDHAAYTRQQDGRLLICPECKRKIIETLES